MSHLVIIDGHAIAHRAYHSIPPLTHNGQPVNAIYGFFSMLLTILSELKPDNLIVCLDSPGPTFRSHEFMAYRAQRKPTDHDLVSQLPLLPKILTQASIDNCAMGGYEADDLIATLCTKHRDDFEKITIITGDKDLFQLINDKVSVYMPIRGLSETKLFNAAEVFAKMGAYPNQIVDLKALMGDPSDNYPGVAGVGPKNATDLLTKYQNLDGVYQNLENIPENLRLKLEKDKQNAYLSQKLATLIDNIPITCSLASSAISDQTYIALSKIFSDYNFKSLYSRINKTKKNEPTLSLF